ncbi:MAG TPA: LLM class flavin-dependent oxidoreductase [Pseudolysinimonas sp.]|nr:LLM class flavin-dependent oxidoreductase [Pseudolysinimonas sp.]
MPELEFYSIVDRSYRWFTPAQNRESIGIDLPNSEYDPDLGQQVLEEVAQGAQRAERLGFDGLLIFEQHNTPLALFPNALTGAAWLSAKTTGIKIVAGGPILNAYSSPVRLAEEIALVDTVSNGRLTVALPLGIGAQYHGYGAMNPVHARAKFREGVELLHKIWAEDGPFAWEGEHYHHPYVNVWPRQRQDPHPEVFITAAGSRETIELAAKYDATYQAILTPMPILTKNTQLFRDLREEYGHKPDRKKIAAVISIHTAETDEIARAEVEKHALWGLQNVLRFPFNQSFPPGHVSQASLRGMMSGGYRSSDPSLATWEQITEGYSYIAGSPETVIRKLTELTDAIGAGRVICSSDFTLPMWLQEKAQTIFANDVIPAFRAPDGLAVWQREKPVGYTTATERAGRKPHYAGTPTVGVNGEYVPLLPQ